jgi:hypothetical protein
MAINASKQFSFLITLDQAPAAYILNDFYPAGL